MFLKTKNSEGFPDPRVLSFSFKNPRMVMINMIILSLYLQWIKQLQIQFIILLKYHNINSTKIIWFFGANECKFVQSLLCWEIMVSKGSTLCYHLSCKFILNERRNVCFICFNEIIFLFLFVLVLKCTRKSYRYFLFRCKEGWTPLYTFRVKVIV